MNLSIIDDFLLQKIKDKIFTEKEIGNLVYSIIDYYELSDYLRGIVFQNINKETSALYNFDDLVLKIDMNTILNSAYQIYGDIDADFIYFANLYILESITHEIIHVAQNQFIDDNLYILSNTYIHELNYLGEGDIKKYYKYYPCFTFEREAEILANKAIIKLINDKLDDKKFMNWFIYNIKEMMLAGYENKKAFISPIEKLYKEVFNENAPNIELEDQYCRILLGLPVSHSNLNVFKRYSKCLIKEHNNIV